MKKYFNTAGPCYQDKHYMISVLERSQDILSLMEYEQYFVIRAAGQTGKTTIIQHLTDYLNKAGNRYALYCLLESASIYSEAKEGIPEIFNIIKYSIEYSKLPNKDIFAHDIDKNNISNLIKNSLRDYCASLDKPLVIFFDEIDSLKDNTLLSFLRQLRDGYINRNSVPFPSSIVLTGMRNIRDYKNKIRDENQTLGSASPFNIIAKSLTVSNFSSEEVEQLLNQHTEITGQVFPKNVAQEIFRQTSGQPWLVNAIAKEIVHDILNNDYSKKITTELVDEAVKNIIIRRDTHIDSLLFRLKEDRVRKVIEPMILGNLNYNLLSEDIQFCIDLGLIKDSGSSLVASNLIYKEIIIRYLSADSQHKVANFITGSWINKDNQLQMDGLLKNFQQFWRENSDIWIEKYEYKEAAPHLILQAFLQRIINGGGKIIREYATGRQRMDICIIYKNKKYPIEIKIKYSQSVKDKGIKQLADYMDKMGVSEGWLIIFDRNPNKNWDEKILWETTKHQNKTINIVGC